MASLYHILNISQQDMQSRLLDLDLVSNNLANANTIGYKANRANFQEYLTAAGNEGGVQLSATQVLNTQGKIAATDNDLDLAIQGEGYFEVQLEDGTIAYTRDGQFRLDNEGQLVTADGNLVVMDGDIPANAENVIIDSNGTVYADDGTVSRQVGSLQLAWFTNPDGLISQGDNLWMASEVSGEAQIGDPGSQNLGTIISSAVEESTVDLAAEMTHMMTIQRSFQMATRTFQQTDEMISEAIHMRSA